MTALGAALVFTARDLSQRALDGLLGFAAGVMIAASYWSLLAPAVEMSRGGTLPDWFPAATGFLVGGLCLWGGAIKFCLIYTSVFARMKLRDSRPVGIVPAS